MCIPFSKTNFINIYKHCIVETSDPAIIAKYCNGRLHMYRPYVKITAKQSNTKTSQRILFSSFFLSVLLLS